MAETIFRNEPEHPMHIVPECWKVFNQRNNIERGLFFLDGSKWHQMRKKMNPVFLKNTQQGLLMAKSSSRQVTDELIEEINQQVEASENCQIEIELESILHKWSVESTLATLFGNQRVLRYNTITIVFKNMHSNYN